MDTLNTAYFFANPEIEAQDNFKTITNLLKEYSKEKEEQIYFLNKSLIDEQNYDVDSVGVILKPDHKIIFIKLNEVTEDSFEDFIDDFIEDTGYLAAKYEHTKILGRPKRWKDSITINKLITNPQEILETITNSVLVNYEDRRNANLIISLLIGSINDIDHISQTEPEDALTAVKKKILLFDGDQTRFIHKKLDKKIVKIQGLSGTGKTELLLHKLKEIYTTNPNSKIMVTCHNKILADSLRKRIPKFFDFMKIEQQISWQERLWCVNAWGSRNNIHSGALRYICDFYDIPFETFSKSTTFDSICKRARNEIAHQGKEEYPFDYIIIDESQDFPDSFIDLCQISTKRKVFIAGDIFQSIFDDPEKAFVESDFLLNRCYRTHPKTLMFSHALGMNLFEPNKQLRWLEKEQWQQCGYNVKDYGKEYILSRDPVRRFEDIKLDESSVHLINSNITGNTPEIVVEIIKNLQEKYRSISPDDIAIVLITNNNQTNNLYDLAKHIEREISSNFNPWECNIAYETKQKIEDKVFITNTNNIKGLEFPFVICICNEIKNTHFIRNSLYMGLTRSFLESYLITFDQDIERINHISLGLDYINTKTEIKCQVPSIEVQKAINTELSVLNDKKINSNELIDSLTSSSSILDPSVRNAIRILLNRYLAENLTATNEEVVDKYKETLDLFNL